MITSHLSTSRMDPTAETKKPEQIMAEIEAKLATIDGISTADAFAIGRMVQQYGQACAGDVAGGVMKAMLSGLDREKRPASRLFR